MGTIQAAIDERSNILVEHFVADNAAMRTTVDGMKVVMGPSAERILRRCRLAHFHVWQLL